MEDALFCGLKRKKEDTFVVAMGEWKGFLGTIRQLAGHLHNQKRSNAIFSIQYHSLYQGFANQNVQWLQLLLLILKPGHWITNYHQHKGQNPLG